MEEAEMELEEVLASNMDEVGKKQHMHKLQERIEDCEERIDLALEEMLRYVAAEDGDSEAVCYLFTLSLAAQHCNHWCNFKLDFLQKHSCTFCLDNEKL